MRQNLNSLGSTVNTRMATGVTSNSLLINASTGAVLLSNWHADMYVYIYIFIHIYIYIYIIYIYIYISVG